MSIFVKYNLLFVKHTLLIMDKNINLNQKKTLKNTRILAVWTLLWLVTMALVSFGAKFLWNFNTAISITFVIINLIAGFGMIIVNIKYLRGLDELQQKVLMDAMGISLGIGVVVGLSYSLLDVVNIIKNDAEISYLVMLIGITYIISVAIGNMRYR